MQGVYHVRKGDTVVALSGNFKGKTGKVIGVDNFKGQIQVEGIGTQKRHTKPSQANPKGGIIEKLRWWPASKFQVSEGGKAAGRPSFEGQGKAKKRTFSKKKKK